MSIDLDALAIESLAKNGRTNFISFKGVFLPEDYELIADAVENFEVRDDDVWVCSFPKTGTTWVQEMVWGVTHDSDLGNSREHINIRFPFLEFSGTTSFARVARREQVTDVPSWVPNSVEFCKNSSSPRHIKSHLPFHLLPRQIRNGERKPKIVYISRNAKDTCISYYHFLNSFEGHHGTLKQFCQLFLGDKVIYGPFWDHLLGFWGKEDMKNLLIIKFEDMKKDLQSVIRKTASFLGKELSNDKVLSLADHLSFTQMKENSSLNRNAYLEFIKSTNFFGNTECDGGNKECEGKFFRDGRSGQWKTVMSPEMIRRFDERIETILNTHKDLQLYLSGID
ncbi:hypothetical protein QAD02_001193 [Eretmocerus hayati]|uniref:Uncharacterized protein n=1 Tax=Eretmocerus hayati TaxID=131215 RepID=A0ACC2NHZ2_9HYME|nr:hypothetical protein QAD02_001193 [Eretmocerus hayati]